VGIGVQERFRNNFGALISKLLSDFFHVVKFLGYLIFQIYAIVAFKHTVAYMGNIFRDLLNLLTF